MRTDGGSTSPDAQAEAAMDRVLAAAAPPVPSQETEPLIPDGAGADRVPASAEDSPEPPVGEPEPLIPDEMPSLAGQTPGGQAKRPPPVKVPGAPTGSLDPHHWWGEAKLAEQQGGAAGAGDAVRGAEAAAPEALLGLVPATTPERKAASKRRVDELHTLVVGKLHHKLSEQDIVEMIQRTPGEYSRRRSSAFMHSLWLWLLCTRSGCACACDQGSTVRWITCTSASPRNPEPGR